jgi:hypothetical protein
MRSIPSLINHGIPSYKLVIGQKISKRNLSSSGQVKSSEIGTWTKKAFEELGWYSGVALS